MPSREPMILFYPPIIVFCHSAMCHTTLSRAHYPALLPSRLAMEYCNRRNFRTRFHFVFFILLAESTKFCRIHKPYTCTGEFDTALEERKFIAHGRPQTLEYEIFKDTKISAITVFVLFIFLVMARIACSSCDCFCKSRIGVKFRYQYLTNYIGAWFKLCV